MSLQLMADADSSNWRANFFRHRAVAKELSSWGRTEGFFQDSHKFGVLNLKKAVAD